jgi:hypothetical protein
MSTEVFQTIIVQFSLSTFFVVLRWQRSSRNATQQGLTAQQRQRYLLKDVGQLVLYLVLAIILNAVFIAVAPDNVELWSLPVLVLAFGIWWWLYTLRFRRNHPPKPDVRSLYTKAAVRDLNYHDYRLMIYQSGWAKPEGWILTTPFLKEDEAQQLKLTGFFYKRRTSVDEIEKDLKNKIDERLNLK